MKEGRSGKLTGTTTAITMCDLNDESVSKCQTSYIEDASAPVDNNGNVAGRGDTVQTECH